MAARFTALETLPAWMSGTAPSSTTWSHATWWVSVEALSILPLGARRRLPTAFADNRSTRSSAGGAITAERGPFSLLPSYGPVSISRSTLTGNSNATTNLFARNDVRGGGAIASYDHSLTIKGSTFTKNTPTTVSDLALGGAVMVFADSLVPPSAETVNISTSVFESNWPAQQRHLLRHRRGHRHSRSGAENDREHGPPRNGAAQGGAIFNAGTLTLMGAVLISNSVSGFDQTPIAGGLFNAGTATLTNDAFLMNPPLNCAMLGTATVKQGVESPGLTCVATPCPSGSAAGYLVTWPDLARRSSAGVPSRPSGLPRTLPTAFSISAAIRVSRLSKGQMSNSLTRRFPLVSLRFACACLRPRQDSNLRHTV